MAESLEWQQGLKDHLKCAKCRSVVESAPMYQCHWGHLFCQSCWTIIQKCSTCGSKNISRAFAIEKLIDGSGQNCIYCKKFVLDINHEKNCQYVQVECRYCTSLVFRKDIRSHEKECKISRKNCPYCSKFSRKSLRDFDDHIMYRCPNRKISCENIGCNFVTKAINRDFAQHQQVCEFRTIRCAHVGCKTRLPLNQIEKHEKNCEHGKRTCYFCNTKVSLKNIHAHLCKIENPRVQCDYCDTDVKLTDLNSHEEVCKILNSKVECNQCGIKVALKDLKIHEDTQCKNQRINWQPFNQSIKVNCVHCGKSFEAKDLDDHERNHCLIVFCTNEGCDFQGLPNNMSDHKELCAFRLVRCVYQECTSRLPWNHLQEHEKRCPYRLRSCRYPNCRFSTYSRRQLLDHEQICMRRELNSIPDLDNFFDTAPTAPSIASSRVVNLTAIPTTMEFLTPNPPSAPNERHSRRLETPPPSFERVETLSSRFERERAETPPPSYDEAVNIEVTDHTVNLPTENQNTATSVSQAQPEQTLPTQTSEGHRSIYNWLFSSYI